MLPMRNVEQESRAERVVVKKGLRLEQRQFHNVFDGIIKLQDLLPDHEDELNLLSLPLQLRVYDSRFFTAYAGIYTGEGDAPVFYGKKLMLLLNEARPHQPGDPSDYPLGKGGMLADLKDITPGQIAAHGKDLNEYWSDFWNNHRKKFIQATDVFMPEDAQKNLEDRAERLLRLDVALQNLAQLIQKEFEGTGWRRKLFISHLYSPSIQKYLKIRWNSDFDRDSDSETEKAIINALVRLPRVQQKNLLRNGLLRRSDIFDPAQKTRKRTLKSKYPEEKRVSLGNGEVRLLLNGSWIHLRTSSDGTKQETDRHIEETSEYGMIPQWSWVVTKQTGQRFYLTSRIPDWLVDGFDSRGNSLLGLTVARYLSGYNLPFREHLSSYPGESQEMKEVQILVQDSWKRAEYLDKSLLLRVEEYVRSDIQK
jgi:hypothetical protein